MPIDIPKGSFHNDTWVGWRLTIGDRYLILPAVMAERLEAVGRVVYWRFMTRQLRRISLPCDPRNAWRAFAD